MQTKYASLIFDLDIKIRKIKDKAMAEITDEQDKVLAQFERDLIALGWERWSKTGNLYTDEQMKRLHESAENSGMNLINYDEKNMIATIYDNHRHFSVSGNGCTCSDFISRGMPCKHMCYLAGILIDRETRE